MEVSPWANTADFGEAEAVGEEAVVECVELPVVEEEAVEAEAEAEAREDDGRAETRVRVPRISKFAWRPPPRRVKLTANKLTIVRGALEILGRPEPDGDAPPPSDLLPERSGAPRRQQRHGSGRGRPLPPQRIAGGGPLASVRRQLPVAPHRAELLQALRQPISLIQGETGSGKTTQIVQLLIEEAAAEGRSLRVVCTQPRRISAIGVAKRIAAERGEVVGTGAVGYAVRGEVRQSASNSLLVCTVGVLLRRLEEDPDLRSFDVVLVDEVHERSVEHDLLLLALRRILSQQEQQQRPRTARARRPRRRATARDRDRAAPTTTMTATATATAPPPPPPPRLRVGLMSATADAALLEGYFAAALRAPVVRVAVDGRSYPVETLHLEHALAATRHVVRPAAAWCIHSEVATAPCNPLQSLTAPYSPLQSLTPLRSHGGASRRKGCCRHHLRGGRR